MKKILGTLALAAMCAPAAPAFAQSRAERQLMADIRILQEQAQQLANAVAALNESLKAINARFDQQAEATRKSFADQKLLIDNMAGDVRVIRERTDETNVRIATLGQEIDALRLSIPIMPIPAPTPDPADPNAPEGVQPTAPAPVLPSPAAGLSPTRMYEQAWADYTAGQWTLAIQGFEAFLKTFPRAELADEAQFYIGDTHFAQGVYADAITAYNQVIQNYPGTNSAPDAYYKRGLAQERLGQTDAARASWEHVMKEFPNSDAGRLAKQNLDRLGNRKPGAQ